MKRLDKQLGESHVAVGEDGRCCLPGSIRDKYYLGETVKAVEVTIDHNDVMLVFLSESALNTYIAKMAKDTPGIKESDISYFFNSMKRTVKVETRGRLLLPEPLRGRANITDRVKVVDGGGYLYILPEEKHEARYGELLRRMRQSDETTLDEREKEQ